MKDDDEEHAETRSAPGDLNEEAAEARSRRERYQRHQRNAPGFTSGPPWPTHKKEPWQREIEVKQERLIEKEIHVLAQESQCGLGKWRPKWMQRFATKHWMLLWLCWYCTVQGLIVNGLVPSSITSIERRFKLPTSTIGRIMQFYDFGYVLFCIPVSYFGGRHSKPAVLACGLMLMALGSLLFSTPHMIADSYTQATSGDEAYGKCASPLTLFANGSTDPVASVAASRQCPAPENQPGTFRYVFLFCLAHFLHGIGATPLFTIGVSFIDENVGPALSSLFVGIFYAFAIFGPAFGFLISGNFLQYHTDFLHLPPEQFLKVVNLEETDPRWVGAWWLGFQLATVIALVAVFPIMALPKVLPDSLKWHRSRLRNETLTGGKKRTPECCGVPASGKTAAITGGELLLDDKAASNALHDSMPAVTAPRKGPLWYQLWLDVRHIPIAIYRILSNGSYMLITLAMAIDGLVVTGASSFMSKYLERQFNVAPSKANVLIGCIMVPMAGVGTMLSGFIVQQFRLSCVKTLKFSIALLFFSLLLTPMYLIYCDHDPLVGVEEHYPGSQEAFDFKSDPSKGLSLYSQCNKECDCLEAEYHPVCAEFTDGTQKSFYSPCFAGCPDAYQTSRKFYDNCTCVPNNTKGAPMRLKKGFCESKCSGLFGFLVLFAPLSFCTFAVGVPLISVVLRTVDYAERSFALGIQWILVRVIGTIPAPVLFGWMFDVSCIQTSKDECSGESGSCMLYVNKLLADLFLTFSIIGQSLAMVILICVLVFFGSSMRDEALPMKAEETEGAEVEAGEIEHEIPEKEPLTVGSE
ncbi:unnamed protein product, partial [Mesorhabditis belari]|uniref:Solute carrier organic anion transporter family member n=1 Tax=Mesorhabditis belari TaxID=2138241 RepID=A0AAF3F0T8_9BILA